MSSLLKDLYSPHFYNRFADVLVRIVPLFSKQEFVQLIFDESFARKEWKDRMKHTTQVLHQFFPEDYQQATKLIEQVIKALHRAGFKDNALEFMFLPDYIETYGLDYFGTSVKALEMITQFVSCEFAVRPFLLQYADGMLKQMIIWATHENDKVRRLASEGSRPRLPWAMAIPAFKKDPTPIFPILELLKDDPSESVRRSVANNLNDIAKDHPHIVMAIARKWSGISKETDAIIKHGSRSLLKGGHVEMLAHYGLQTVGILLENFTILTPVIIVGSSLQFSFTVQNSNPTPCTIRLEYAVYYRRKKEVAGKKVFKISERTYGPGEKAKIQRRQSFKPITTRTFYAGKHDLSIILNGKEMEVQTFDLQADHVR